MKKTMGKKCLSLVLAISMICSLFAMGVSAADKESTVSVIVRIEGSDKTIAYPTRYKVKNFSLEPFGGTEKSTQTVLHALIQALDLDETGPDEDVLTVDGSTGVIDSIDGESSTQYREWRYAINDAVPDNISCADCPISDGDEIVFYYTNTDRDFSSYTYFNEETKTVAVGEKFNLILNSVFYDNDAQFTGPTADADVLVSTNGANDATEKSGVKTDNLGCVELTFDAPGTYVVSAERYSSKYSDMSNISRPRCVVTVTGSSSNNATTTKPTITAGEGGTATLSADNKTVTIKANDGYQVKDVTVNGTSVGAVSSYTLSAAQAGAKIAITFEKTKVETPAEDNNNDVVVPSTDTFSDVANHWAKDAISYAIENGLFSGTTATTFSPDSAMTRGMFVTVLGRYAKANNVSGITDFNDVDEEAYYAPYVAWANQNGIVSGVSEKEFAPNTAITREQMAVMMQKFAAYMTSSDVAVEGMVLREFNDYDQISAWAMDGLIYCVQNGFMSGKGNNTLDPKGTATRAEVATVLQKLIANFN